MLKLTRDRLAYSMTALGCLASASLAGAEDWARFRGPNGEGRVVEAKLPTEVKPDVVRWKADLGGEGHSSPVIVGDRVYITHVSNGVKLTLACLDAHTGKERWAKTLDLGEHRLHRYNSYASSTPAADAERVYLAWNTGRSLMLTALSHAGEEAWSRDLGPYESQHGMGMSPAVLEGKVILPNLQDGASFIAAFDARSGKDLWRTACKSADAAYGTPCLYRPADRKPEIIFNSKAHGIAAVDPDTGTLLWQSPDLFKLRSASSSVIAQGLALGSCGSGGGGNYLVAVRPPPAGGKPQVVWRLARSAPYVPTSVAAGDRVYAFNDGGIVTSLVATTGEVKWQERVEGTFFGSPVCAGDRLYALTREGKLVVIKTSDRFEKPVLSDLGEASFSTPAVGHGRLYLRTLKTLWCVGAS
jgi:outer membrane protein assembly factor BamB